MQTQGKPIWVINWVRLMLNWLVSMILPWCPSSFLNFSPLERERARAVVGLNDTLTSPEFPCWKKRKEKTQYYCWGIVAGCPISLSLTFEARWLTHFRLRISGRLICNAKEKTSISVKRVFFFLTFFAIINRVQGNEHEIILRRQWYFMNLFVHLKW